LLRRNHRTVIDRQKQGHARNIVGTKLTLPMPEHRNALESGGGEPD
jgi:hypothetical protein